MGLLADHVGDVGVIALSVRWHHACGSVACSSPGNELQHEGIGSAFQLEASGISLACLASDERVAR